VTAGDKREDAAQWAAVLGSAELLNYLIGSAAVGIVVVVVVVFIGLGVEAPRSMLVVGFSPALGAGLGDNFSCPL
jgi:hypothetical protein